MEFSEHGKCTTLFLLAPADVQQGCEATSASHAIKTQHYNTRGPKPHPNSGNTKQTPCLGGAGMTRILSDNNSWDSYGPLIQPPEVWKGGNCQKLLSLYFVGNSNYNKNATFQGGSPVDPSFRTPCGPPF